jgi:methylglyoxal synthase
MKKKIALVAHDHKKKDLIEWVKMNRELLLKHTLIATGTTGKLVGDELGIDIIRLKSGPLGGDQQIGAMVAESKLDMMIFFWDPLSAQPHDTDVKALLRIAVVWNIPIACNRSSADFLITSRLMDEDYERAVPDYEDYQNRSIDD